MRATDAVMFEDVFKFSGQSKLDTWKMREVFEAAGWRAYSNWLVDEFPFMLQRIRDLADAFPFWQRFKNTGAKPHKERTLLITFLLGQLFDSPYRNAIGLLKIFKCYFGINRVPHYSILSRKNSSKRWFHLWKRVHRFVLDQLPARKSVVATDATGFSGRIRAWKDTPYAQRANENWVKVHAATEIDSFLILNYELTKSNVHDSQVFEDVWEDLPDNVTPIQSLADAAYTSQACLDVANQHGAKAFHEVKCNAVYVHHPNTSYERLVNFYTHWPNRYKEIKGKRAHIETSFGSMKEAFGHRIRCKTAMGRKNEVQAKINIHNIRMLAASAYMAQV